MSVTRSSKSVLRRGELSIARLLLSTALAPVKPTLSAEAPIVDAGPDQSRGVKYHILGLAFLPTSVRSPVS